MSHNGAKAKTKSERREAPRWDPEVIEGGTAIAPAARASEHPAQSPEPEDGAQLLNDISAALKRFVWFPEARAYDLLSVYVLYTHVYDSFDFAPRVAFWSPAPGMGKSTALRVLQPMVRKGLRYSVATAASVFRRMDVDHPTLMLDELDKVMKRGMDPTLNGILNEGHLRGGAIPRVNPENGKVEEFDPFGPVLFGYKDVSLPPDLEERTLRINMQKPPRVGLFEKFKSKRHTGALIKIGARAHTWAKNNTESLIDWEPKIPTGIDNRFADNWLPLLAVAEAAGGDWPKYIARAASWIEAHRSGSDNELHILTDPLAVFDRKGADWLLSKTLVKEMNKNEEWPWGEQNGGEGLNVYSLARKLKKFDIKPKVEKGRRKQRGYWRKDFEAAAKRYGVLPVISTERRGATGAVGATPTEGGDGRG